jgi:hypothetical protein
MKIAQAIVQRELIKLTIDDEGIVIQWGEPLDFYTWNKQPIEIMLAFAASHTDNYIDIESILAKLILNKDGEQVLTAGYKMPNDVLLAAYLKLVEALS